MPDQLKNTRLFDKVHAAMLAAAIGDAMGGPVEGWSYEKIAQTYGVVDEPLPYDFPSDYHNQFRQAAGTVTDDTRLRHLVAQTIIDRRGLPQRGDLVWAVVEAYHGATTKLERGFLEEYALGGVHGEEKLIWGGQMTNGFLMANAPLGLVVACDPNGAFELSYDLDFISDGYAKYAAAMGAAVVASALKPEAQPLAIVEDALKAAEVHRREGPLTRQWQWYDHVFQINERLLNTAVELALQAQDVFGLRAAYYEQLEVSELGSEAAQTLAVALGMIVAAGGDLRQAVIGCVNYGRDNDSYATLAGAITGAMHGTAPIPDDWWQTVVAANPEFDVRALALGLTEVALTLHQRRQRVTQAVDALLSSARNY